MSVISRRTWMTRPTKVENVGREHFPVQTESSSDRRENVPVVHSPLFRRVHLERESALATSTILRPSVWSFGDQFRPRAEGIPPEESSSLSL
jgi:hypothetical protein